MNPRLKFLSSWPWFLDYVICLTIQAIRLKKPVVKIITENTILFAGIDLKMRSSEVLSKPQKRPKSTIFASLL
jgi:hypothetical protein